MRTANWVILLPLVSLNAFGQAPAPRLEFEVASIKPAVGLDASNNVSVGMHIDGAQVRFTYTSIKDLMRWAYQVKPFQVEGPDWIGAERYDIAAKLPEGTKRDQVPAMLQNLLAERFQVVLHHTSKEMPVVALVVAKTGLKIKESPTDPNADTDKDKTDIAGQGGPQGVSVNFGHGASYSFGDNKFEARHMTMTQVADSISRYEADPVVDMTELKGQYDFVLNFTPEDYRAMLIRAAVSAGVSLPPEALRLLDQGAGDSLGQALGTLGLKLERRRAPLDVIVVDKANKTPTSN
jgi:uncharacterized protein (TIGR03435 family)